MRCADGGHTHGAEGLMRAVPAVCARLRGRRGHKGWGGAALAPGGRLGLQ